MITLNAIAKRLEEFGTNHFFIKSYSFGSPDDVDLDKFQDFPLMHVVYTGSDYEERTKTFSFEVYVFDRPNREEQMTINQREVVSDAQQCLEDVIADIANGGNIFLFDEDYEVTTAGITPLIDERSNLLTGALLDLTIQVPYQRDACNLPIDGVQSAGGEISYRRRGILRVRTQDGTTDVQSVNEIRVTNGTLTDEGDGIVSIDTGGVDILGDLENVNLSDPQDHEALVYDQDTATWINGASTKIGIRVINQTGGTLYAGTPLRATGVQGDQITVEIYNATQDGRRFIGLLSADIANGETGYARQTGTIYNLNTLRFNVGDILYPAKEIRITINNGLEYMDSEFGVTGPDEPFAKIPCAIVLRRHFTTGRIYVRTWTPSRNLEDLTNVYTVGREIDSVLRWNGYQWTAGDQLIPSLNDLRDVEITNPELIPNKSLLRWDAFDGIWRVIPETGGSVPTLPNTIAYYLGRYNNEATTARQAADATLTIERYLSAQADGLGEEITVQTDTPTSGNKIVRKIWHKGVSFEDSDVTTWTLVHTFADDTAYADTTATFDALLTAATYGSIPFTLAQTWEDIPAFTGLLDTYPGAAAAYSLRLLDANYSGPCIRVRRSGDNAEQDIGFDGAGEVDRDAIATFCSPGDGFVKIWYDQSGNGYDVVQATTSAQPQIVSSGTIVTDSSTSKPAVYGRGLDYLINTSFTPAFTNFTAVAVAHEIVDGSDTFRGLWSVLNGTNLSTLNIVNNYIWTGNYDRLYINGVFADYTPTLGSAVLKVQEFDGSDVTVYQNGTQKATATTGSFTSSPQSLALLNGFSTAYKLLGYISEFVLYNSDQSSNRTGIEANINAFYNIY